MAENTIRPRGALRSRAWPVRYATALIATGVALWVWLLWPVMHQDPFAIFIAAVIVSARFAGFGPAVLCTATSATALDYFVFSPRLSLALSANDYERMLTFVSVSVLTAGLARQRSRAEVRTNETQRRMAAIVEFSHDAIISATPDGNITTWNRGAEELYGYSAEEAVGRHLSFLAPVARVKEIHLNLETVTQGQPVESYQTERLRKDGQHLPVLLSVSPLRNQRGFLIGCSLIARDISALRLAEEALRRNERLATAGRLSATIAHEINNPLEAVNNLLYLARHDSARRDEHLTMAEREVQHVAAIARQTLGFVRESATPVRLDIGPILDEVLLLYARKLGSKNIHVEKLYAEPVMIEGYPGELSQLFANLILNAIDALATGGKLYVRVHRDRGGGNNLRPGIRVIIADNGTGIPMADRQQIFEAFFTTKKDLGTGLGLWLCGAIVEKHGGSLRLRSGTAAGRSGTVFAVFLPEHLPKEPRTS